LGFAQASFSSVLRSKVEWHSQLIQYLATGITTGAIYALVALGFTIIYNSTEIINFAQGEFVMLGGMIAAGLLAMAGMPMWAAIMLAIAFATIIGIIFEQLSIRPVKNPSVMNLIIITIGGSILIKGAAMIIWGKDDRPLRSFSSSQPLHIFGAAVTPQSLWVMTGTLLAVILLHFFYEYTITGKALRACAYNRKAAKLCGISVERMVLFSFGLSAALGAFAGILIAPITFTSYDVGTMLGLKGFCAAIFGGLGSNPGAVLGGLVIGTLESLSAGYVSSGYKDAVAFLIMLLVLYFRPAGIFGKRTEKV
jgi:branched-chain amino acid transport system permease protein